MEILKMNPQNWCDDEATLKLYADGRTFAIYDGDKFQLVKKGHQYEVRGDDWDHPVAILFQHVDSSEWTAGGSFSDILDGGITREHEDPRVAAALYLWNVL